MNKLKTKISAIFTIAFIFIGVVAQTNAQQQGRINEREINNIITRLNVKLDDFRYGLDSGGNRNPVSQNDYKQISEYLNDLKSDIDSFQNKLDDRNDSQEDVRQILESAKSVNDYSSRLRLTTNVQNDWNAARNLLGQLASKYNVSWNWNSGAGGGGANYPNSSNYPNNNYPPVSGNFNNGLTGTYRLDTSRSENISNVASDAINNVDPQRREEARRDLEQKIQPPDQLAIDLRGNQVTLASSIASQITFPADGTDRTETLPDGSTMRIRATLRGQVLTVASLGGNNDYTVIFTPIDNGRSLKVTRRVTTDYLRQTVFAESVYTKTDSIARLDNYNNPNNYPNNNPNQNNYPTTTTGNYPPTTNSRPRTGRFIVANGTILTGTLENPMVSTKVSQNNDPFKLRVQSPTQFRGALVEGYLSGINSAGRVSGRSQMTFNFERITMPDGQVYDFSGFLQSVTNEKGDTIKVDSEGAAKGGNQTKTTAIRSGIGAGLGALIGAIAGGGKGAAIGAIVGGGAGAGSVFIQNEGDLELKQGSSITFQASSPVR